MIVTRHISNGGGYPIEFSAAFVHGTDRQERDK